MKTLLDEALESWEDARNGVIEEADNIPANQFDFRPTPDVRSVAELIVHIMEVSLMMTGELTRDDTNLRRYPWPRLLADYAAGIQKLRTKRELMPALRRTLREGIKEFQRAGEIHLLQQIVRFDGEKGTRLAWFHHGVEQEMYHRGQLATYARLIGLKPALTKKIEGIAQ
jgi:uncharacterized damage-inducible protein DinB